MTRLRLIPLTQGQYALVDNEDWKRLKKFKWCALWSPYTKSFYARRSIWLDGKTFVRHMAREIVGLKVGDKRQADHKNCDTLDNTRRNLRVSTVGQNQANRRGVNSNNKSGHTGVFFNNHLQKWQAGMKINGKYKCFGRFNSFNEACEVRTREAKQLFGAFAGRH